MITLTAKKEMLDDMHKRKINIVDSIYVINLTCEKEDVFIRPVGTG